MSNESSKAMLARDAYVKWCELNGVEDVYTVIENNLGKGEVEYTGLIPSSVIHELDEAGYFVNVIEISTVGDNPRFSYHIAWGK